MKVNSYRSLLLAVILMITASFHVAEGVLSTSLRVTVLDELGNPAVGVPVSIFASKPDYKAEVNPVVPTDSTDEKGRVTFKGLDPISYFVHAELEGKSNIGGAVLTAVLIEGKTNKVNTTIE
ncbi:MAG: carboxypeptidase-like regulatory domain-containing protein [Reichenbachiella sp.]